MFILGEYIMKLRNLFLLFTVLMVTISVSACSKKENKEVSDDEKYEDLLLVESESIKVYASSAFQDLLEEGGAQHGKTDFETVEKLMEAVLDNEINKNYIYEDAIKTGFYSDKDKNNLAMKFYTGLTMRSEISKKVYNEINPTITDEDVKKATPKTFNKLTLRKILVKTREDGEKVLNELKKGADFGEMVKKYSIDPTKQARKGITDEFTINSVYFTNPKDEDQAFCMNKGERCDRMVESPLGGYMIYEVYDKVVCTEEGVACSIKGIRDGIYQAKSKEYFNKIKDSYKDKIKILDVELSNALEKYLKGEDVSKVKVGEFNGNPILFSYLGWADNTIYSSFFKGSSLNNCFAISKGILERYIDTLISEDYFKDVKLPKRLRIVRDNLVKKQIATAYMNSMFNSMSVTDEEVKQFYEENLDLFTAREVMKAAVIFVNSREEALKIIKQYKSGKDFGELALKFSTDVSTKSLKGSIGWVDKKNTFVPPALFEAMTKTKTGEISEPIKTETGKFVIFKINDRQDQIIYKLEEYKDWAKEQALGKKMTNARVAFFKKIKGKDIIKRNEENIKKVITEAKKQLDKKAPDAVGHH